MRTTLLSVLMLCFLGHLAHAQEATYATVTQAAAISDGQGVAVDLTIDARSWKYLTGRGITPMISIWVGRRGLRYDRTMKAAHDTLSVQLPSGEGSPDRVRVMLSGSTGSHNLAWIQIGNIQLTELTLKVNSGQVAYDGGQAPQPPPPSYPPPAPPPAQVNWAGQPQVIKACGDTMTGSTNQQACLDAVRGYRWDPAPMVRACYQAMTGDTNTLTCIRAAAGLQVSAVNTLKACYQAMTGNTNTLTCLSTAARAPYEPSGMIGACYKAMTGNTNALTCIGYGVGFATDPTPTITACYQSMTGDTAVLGCIKRASGQ